jgi:hypothetical protein
MGLEMVKRDKISQDSKVSDPWKREGKGELNLLR